MKQYIVAILALLFLFLFSACNKESPCVSIPLAPEFQASCPTDTLWVCGCDHRSYINGCITHNLGIRVEHMGRCQ